MENYFNKFWNTTNFVTNIVVSHHEIKLGRFVLYLTLILSPNDLYSLRDPIAGKREVFAA